MTAALSPETLAFDTAEVGIEPLRIGNERAEISFTLELITPELAAAYLRLNTRNRPKRSPRVAKIAKAITEGRFKVTSQGIAFDSHGNLSNGQHRLEAVLLTQIAVWMYVARGEDNFALIDTGGMRSVKDILGIENGTATNQATLAAALRIVRNYRMDNDTVGAVSQIDGDEAIAYLHQYPLIAHYVDRGNAICAGSKMTKSAATAAAYLSETSTEFEHLTEAQWADWYEGLTTGANLSLGDPRLHLRRAFERIQKSESQNRRPNVAMAYYLKALRAWAQGQGYGPKGLRLGGTEGVDKNIRAAWRSIGSTEG